MQPSCPGCLRPASADLHEHTCDAVNASFVTGLNTCPICEERLDIAPAFPSLVANYLKRTKAANKVNVTFDYETGAFVPVEDGEFVVVTNQDQAFVLPRATEVFDQARLLRVLPGLLSLPESGRRRRADPSAGVCVAFR